MEENKNDKTFSIFSKKVIKNGKVIENTLEVNGKKINDINELKKFGLNKDLINSDVDKKMEQIKKDVEKKDFTKDPEVSNKIKESILSNNNTTTTTINDLTAKIVLISNNSLKNTKQVVYKYFGNDKTKVYYDSLFDPKKDYDENYVILPLKSVILGKCPDDGAYKGKTTLKYCIKFSEKKEDENKSEYRKWLEEKFNEFEKGTNYITKELRNKFLSELEALGLEWLKRQYEGSEFTFNNYLKLAFTTFGTFNYYKNQLNSVIFTTDYPFSDRINPFVTVFAFKIKDIVPFENSLTNYVIMTEEGNLNVNIFNSDLFIDPREKLLDGVNIVFKRGFLDFKSLLAQKVFSIAKEKLSRAKI